MIELYVCVLARAVCRGAFIIYRDKAKRSEQSRAPKTGRDEDKNEMIKKTGTRLNLAQMGSARKKWMRRSSIHKKRVSIYRVLTRLPFLYI